MIIIIIVSQKNQKITREKKLLQEPYQKDEYFVRYSGLFLKWTRVKLNQIDERTRKLMTIYKTLHLSDDIDTLYVSRKEWGRGLTNIEDSVDTSIQRLEYYIEKLGGRLIAATRNNPNDTRTSGTTIIRKQNWEGKQLHGRFKRLTSDISHGKT